MRFLPPRVDNYIDMQPPAQPGSSPRLQRFLLNTLVALMLLWALVGLISFGSRYVRDLQGASHEPGDILDYHVFYAAADLVREGHGSQIYDLSAVGESESHALGATLKGEDIYPYLNPPFVALMLAPLTFLPVLGFAGVLAAVNLTLLLYTGRSMQRLLGLQESRQRLVFWLLYVTGLPMFDLFLHQQFSLFVVAAWLGFVECQVRGKDHLSGIWLSLALVKPQFVVLPVIFLLWRRNWLALLPFASIALAMAALSVAAAGMDILVDYPRFLMETTRWSDNGIFGQNMLGWQGVLAGLTGDTTPPRALFWALAMPTLALAAWRWHGDESQSRERLPLLMAIALVASLLATPHLYLHDVLLLAPALVFAAMHTRSRTGSLGHWPAIAVGFWVLALPRFMFFFTGLPLLSLAMVALFGVVLLQDRRERASNPAVEPAPMSLPRAA